MSAAPETLRQARRFDSTRNAYAKQGLCNRCAAQAAYGHADGFQTVKAPCGECASIVASFPRPSVNGWRAIAGGSVAI